MPHAIRLDRARGCLLGLAVGDALGAPLEGLSAQQIKSHYGQVTDYVDGAKAWKKKPYRWRMPGLYTDDTQQALAISDVLVECGLVSAQHLAELYLRLATPEGVFLGAHRGVGRSFRLVLENLKKHIDPECTGQDSAGIGAAMRIAPVGVYFADEPDLAPLYDAVIAASLMTHRDIRSLAGACAVACAVRRLAAPDSERSAAFIFRLAADVARFEERIAGEFADRVVSLPKFGTSISRSIAAVEPLLERPRDRAFNALMEEANRHGAEPICRRATMGFPPALIPTCLYVFLTAETFEDAIIEIVNLGGDADSAGAILGAMAGAFWGKGAIPKRWLMRLRNLEGIENRAIALAQRSTEGLTIPDLIETEHRLSDEEAACREDLKNYRPSGGDLGANSRL
jgi:ADP-ribosylglycohydrolase